MSKYNNYAQELNVAFHKAATQQSTAYKAYKDAEKARKAGVSPDHREIYPGENEATKAELEANYEKAKNNLKTTQKKAWQDFDRTRTILSRDLENTVSKSQLADPDAVDQNAVNLMKSGILNAADYQELYNRYSGNATMQRMIGAEARKAAEACDNVEERRTLTAIAYDSQTKKKPEVLEAWDNLCSVSGHYSGESSRNADPEYICKMNSHWDDENTQAVINNF